jgi:hypothetical protein
MAKARSPAIMRHLSGYDGLRVVGDVHGDRKALRAVLDGARSRNYFPLLVGDVVDYGEDSLGCIEEVLNRPCFVLPGNHDSKFIRWLRGNRVKINAGLLASVRQIASRSDGRALGKAYAEMMDEQPLWVRIGRYVIAHASVTPDMTFRSSPPLINSRVAARLRAAALFGETDGTINTDGFPNRTYGWIDRLPAGTTAVIGHDIVPEIECRKGRLGGQAILIDTGCGKGGRLSFLDITMECLLSENAPAQPEFGTPPADPANA